MAEEADRLKQEANKLFKGSANAGSRPTPGNCSRKNTPLQTPLLICLHLGWLFCLCPAEKHYAGAVHLYSQAIELQPENAVLYANRAFAHIKREEYGSAVMDASKAIAADPSYAKVQAAQSVVHP